MKIKRILIYISAIVLLLSVAMCMTSCSDMLDKPTILNLEMDTQTLRWQRVPSAASYEVKVDDEERVRTTTATYISLEYLDAGEHTVSVRAISNNEKVESSEWSTYTFERKPESGLRYKLINNQTEYQLVGIGTAEGDVVMESEYRGKPVTSIADKAFNNTQKLTSIVIAKSVREIGKSAFNKCTELVSVSFEEGSQLKSIGEYAFQSCKKLQSITLPEGLYELPDYMFSWCAALESVSLPSTLSVISSYAFSNCALLKNINFPEELSVIEEYAFSDCAAIEEIVLPDALKTISLFTFSNCAQLKSVTFGDGLESIGDAAFAGCVSLSEITLPDSLKTIGIQSFASCQALGSVTLGEGLTAIGAQAFADTKITNEAEPNSLLCIGSWLIGSTNPTVTKIRIKEGVCGIADYAFAEHVFLETVDIEGVKYIGDYAFAGCTDLWEIVFDDALLTIGDYSFVACTSLTDLMLGNSLVTIGDYSFRGCAILQAESIDLPDTLTAIGTYAFHDTYAFSEALDVVYIDDWVVGIRENLYNDVVIKDGVRGIASYSFYKSMILSITMPDSLEYIGRAAFYNCSYTQLITLPKNLKIIGDYAFFGCSSACFGEGRFTIIPGGTVSIGRSAFYRCVGMVGLSIPESVKTIGDYAFYQCVNLGNSQILVGDGSETLLRGEVTFAEGLESIGSKAFQECRGIVTLTLPKSLKYMGERAFYKCVSLEYLDMRCELTYIPAYAFYGCAALESIEFSDKIKEIGTYAFRGCTSLPKIIIGAGIEKIGNYAFYGCTGVQEIIIPSGVVEIGGFAFRGCSAVSSVLIPKSVELIGMHAFYGLNKASLYCESESVLPYWNERWNSSYRPVFWGCVFSDEGNFVESFVKNENNPENIEAKGGISAPYREGYSFMGWSQDIGGSLLISSSEINSSYNGKTLYPIFVESDYIIEFNPNRPINATHNTTGVMVKTGCLLGTAYNLPLSEYSLIGWDFKGWSTTADGNVVYADGERITEPITTAGGATVVLYAVWEPKPYIIHFEANKPTGASGELIGSMPMQETTLDSVITLYPNQFAIQGWKFLGWSGIPGGEAQIPDGMQIAINATADQPLEVTLYAIWTPITYDIAFNANAPDGVEVIGSMNAVRCSYDSVATVPMCEYSIEGYSFIGWSTTENGTVVYPDAAEIYNATTEDGATITLYAVWQKN